MGSIPGIPSGISFLNQTGTGLLSNLPTQLSTATLQSASQKDVVALSSAALQLQQVDGIFGITPASQAATGSLVYGGSPPTDTNPATAMASSQANINLPAGVSAGELTNATPGQKDAIANAAMQQQMVQALFYPATSLTGTTNVLG